MNEFDPNKPKKRLTMMPEVLPAPTVVTSGSVRRRTLARLRVLAALSAAGLAASCAGKIDTGGGGGGIDPSLPDGGGTDGGQDAYGVVDPLPQPSCFNGRPSATVHFTTDGELAEVDGGEESDAGGLADAGAPGARLVTIDLSFTDTGVVLGAVVSSNDAVVVVSRSAKAQGERIIVRLAAGVTDAQLTATASCSRGPDRVYLELTVSDDDVSVIAE